jgi:hypothetical protein
MEYIGQIMKDANAKKLCSSEKTGREQTRLESCYKAILGLITNDDDDDDDDLCRVQ